MGSNSSDTVFEAVPFSQGLNIAGAIALKSLGVAKSLGDTKTISVCRVSKANDGGVGGCKSISRGTESQDFRGRAAGKRMRTRSRRDKGGMALL